MLTLLKSLARRRWLAAVLLVGVLATACVPPRLGISWASTSLVGDPPVIFVALNHTLLQVDPATGTGIKLYNSDGQIRLDEKGDPRIWNVDSSQLEAPLNAAQFFSAPILEDNGSTFLVAASNAHLFKFGVKDAQVDNTNGIEIPDGVIANIAVDDTTYYLPFNDIGVAAVSRDNPADVLWTFHTDNGVWSAPLLVDGVLYFGSLDHNLYAVDASTGDELWRANLEGGVGATPLLYNGNLYVGSFARKVFEVSAADGTIVNTFDTSNWVWDTPALQDGILYVSDLGGMVYALDTAHDLNAVWTRQFGTLGIRATPLVTQDRVIVATRDGIVYWLNRSDGTDVHGSDGEPLQRKVDVEILANMLLVGPSDSSGLQEPIVVVTTVSTSPLLVAYKLASGEKLWSYPSQ